MQPSQSTPHHPPLPSVLMTGERRRESDHRRDSLLQLKQQQHPEQQQHHDRLPPCCRLGGGGGTVKQQRDWFGRFGSDSDADAWEHYNEWIFSTLLHFSGQLKHQNTNTRMRPFSWWSRDFLWSVPQGPLFWPTWSDSIRCKPLYHHVINKPWLFYDNVVFCHHSFFHDHDHDCLHGLSYVTPL